MHNIIGVDIGGTKTAIVLGTEIGTIIEKIKFDTPPSYKESIVLIEKHIKALIEKSTSSPVSIGISCGGPLDSAAGIILSPPNLPTWDNIPIVDVLQKLFKIPAFLDNDANACCLAEWKWGAGKGFKNVIFLTFGTGLGAGLILNNQIYRGSNFLAGEVGHIRLSDNGAEAYGKKGSAESFCSGTGISRLATLNGMGHDITAAEVFELASTDNKLAQHVVEISAIHLGKLLAILIDILNPDCIIIGSIYSRQELIFAPYVQDIILKESLPLAAQHCKIFPSALGESLGDMAALGVALEK